MTYKDFEEMFPGFKGELTLYISGSQGVSPATTTVKYEQDFTDLSTLGDRFNEFIDDNAMDYYMDYLPEEYSEDDEESDEMCNEAMAECIDDSGDFYCGIDEEHLTYIYDFGRFIKSED